MAIATVCPPDTGLGNELPQFTGGVMADLTLAVFQQDLQRLRLLSDQRQNFNIASRVYDDQKRVWRMECALVTAARLGYLDAVKVLVECGAQLDTTDQIVGKSPLHWACNRHHLDVAGYLLSKGADVNKNDYYTETPIVEAIINRNFNLVKLLLDHRARMDMVVNYDRDSPVLLALAVHATPIARYMIQCGGLLSQINREGEDCGTVILHDDGLAEEKADLLPLLLAAGFKLRPKHIDIACRANDSVTQFLFNHLSSPPRLAWLTRIAIRSHLVELSRNTSIRQMIEQLPLPPWMREFLLLKHI